jgi:hypothetical protein
MANYVSNYIWIEGADEDVQKFFDHVAIRPRLYWEDNERNTYWTDSQHNFSFHSFMTPPDTVPTEEYHATSYYTVDADGNPSKTNDTTYNAGNWNSENWGTSCDAFDVDIYTSYNGTKQINFQTKWSPPIEVIRAMAQQFPNLNIEYEYEEETGWGGKIGFIKGVEQYHNEWDEPSCHQDYVDRDNEDSCYCANYEDEKDWYEDCPRDEPKLYKVQLTYTHYVKASNKELAQEMIVAYDNGFDMPNDVEIVKYAIAPEFLTEEIEELPDSK